MNKILALLLFSTSILFAQVESVTVSGTITSQTGPLAFATVIVKGGVDATTADDQGDYQLEVPMGNITLIAQAPGYRSLEIEFVAGGKEQEVNFELVEDVLGLDELIITATRNRVERRSAPVVVSSLQPRLLTATQSLSLADGLNFAPGVRVETNCQNCGFTQVRLNGLDGAYTQVLLNSRPLFSSLLLLY